MRSVPFDTLKSPTLGIYIYALPLYIKDRAIIGCTAVVSNTITYVSVSRVTVACHTNIGTRGDTLSTTGR